MIIPEDKNKYTSAWRFVEVAKYIRSLSKVIRDKDGDLPLMVDIDEVEEYSEKNKNIRNIYICLAL
jgi:hypothetical protein